MVQVGSYVCDSLPSVVLFYHAEDCQPSLLSETQNMKWNMSHICCYEFSSSLFFKGVKKSETDFLKSHFI